MISQSVQNIARRSGHFTTPVEFYCAFSLVQYIENTKVIVKSRYLFLAGCARPLLNARYQNLGSKYKPPHHNDYFDTKTISTGHRSNNLCVSSSFLSNSDQFQQLDRF